MSTGQRGQYEGEGEYEANNLHEPLVLGLVLVHISCGDKSTDSGNDGGGGNGSENTARIVIVDSLHLPGGFVSEPVQVGDVLALNVYPLNSDSLFIVSTAGGLAILNSSRAIYPAGSHK